MPDRRNVTLPPPYALVQTRHGPMLTNPNDTYVGKALLLYGEYSEAECQVLLQMMFRPGLVIEVGANMGALTVPLARHAARNGQPFLAIEPQYALYQQLCANLALNGLTNAYAQHAACGWQEGILSIPILDVNAEHNFGSVATSWNTEQPGVLVACHTLDQLVADRSVSLVKIDVEGAEIDVLKGAGRTLAQARPLLYIENDRVELSKALIEHLWGSGYTLYWHLPPLFNPENFAGNAKNVYPRTISCNMLCVPSEQDWTINGFELVERSDTHPFLH